MKNYLLTRKYWILGYLGFITFLSLTPGKQVERFVLFQNQDKLAHFGMYGVFVLLLRWALPAKLWNERWIWLVGGVIGYGFLMELGQLSFTHLGRSFSWFDALANTLGAITALLVIKLMRQATPARVS